MRFENNVSVGNTFWIFLKICAKLTLQIVLILLSKMNLWETFCKIVSIVLVLTLNVEINFENFEKPHNTLGSSKKFEFFTFYLLFINKVPGFCA